MTAQGIATEPDRDLPARYDWQPLPEWLEAFSLPPGHRRDYEKARAAILTDAAERARTDPGRWISYSRNKNQYTPPARYRQNYVTHAYVTEAVDELERLGLLEHEKASRSQIGFQSRFRASPQLIQIQATIGGAKATFRRRSLIELREKYEAVDPRTNAKVERTRLMDFRDNDTTRKQVRELEALGEALRPVVITTAAEGLKDCGDYIEFIDGNGNVARFAKGPNAPFRVFNRTFERGGRTYGIGVQNFPKRLREGLIIDGAPAVELDYKALHPRMLYALRGLKEPQYDPYEIDGHWPRWVVKAAFNILLNANGNVLAAFMEWARKNEQPINGQIAREILTEVNARNAPIADLFANDMGARLQRIDSDMMAHITQRLIAAGHPPFPIHDSVIVSAPAAGLAQEVMQEAWHKFVTPDPLFPAAIKAPDPVRPVLVIQLPLPPQADFFISAPHAIEITQEALAYDGGKMPAALCKAVQLKRRSMGLTLNRLADIVDISRPQISNALLGHYGLSAPAAARVKSFLVS